MKKSRISEVLISEKQILDKVKEIGEQINKDYGDENILLICTLKGAVVFCADLMRCIKSPCELDFLIASSYKDGTESSGNVKIIKDLECDIKGRNVIIVEDIIDTGTTLYNLVKMLKQRKPKTLKICSMFNKPSRRKVEMDIDYIGYDIPDKFVIGYGLDYAQLYRNIPYLGVVELVDEE